MNSAHQRQRRRKRKLRRRRPMDMADVEELGTLGDDMNINELTIGRVKEIVAMLGRLLYHRQHTRSSASTPFVGATGWRSRR